MIKDIMEVVQILKTFAHRDIKVWEREDVLEDIENVDASLAKELRQSIQIANQTRFCWVKDYSADME